MEGEPVAARQGESRRRLAPRKEAHIDPESLWAGIAKFAADRPTRLARMGLK
jgi:hypothetical protein